MVMMTRIEAMHGLNNLNHLRPRLTWLLFLNCKENHHPLDMVISMFIIKDTGSLVDISFINTFFHIMYLVYFLHDMFFMVEIIILISSKLSLFLFYGYYCLF